MYKKNSRNYGNILIIHKRYKKKPSCNEPFKAYNNQTKNTVDINLYNIVEKK